VRAADRLPLRGRQGDGGIKIEMHFLPNVYAICRGKRYNCETLACGSAASPPGAL
jgi:excinuclease UvrABC ATPase subunit